MMLAAVIFDLDGILTDTVELHYRSWKGAVSEHGIPFTRSDNDHLRGLSRRKSLETILDGKSLSEPEFEAILKKKNQLFLESLDNLGRKDLLPGVESLLKELQKEGMKTAVASASRNTRPVLQKLGIMDSFAVICDSNSIQASKPAPDVFLEARRKLQVASQECIVIEDSPAGIQAAHAAGMCVVGIGKPSVLGEADAVFDSLSHVRLGLLKAIHGLWLAAYPQFNRQMLYESSPLTGNEGS